MRLKRTFTALLSGAVLFLETVKLSSTRSLNLRDFVAFIIALHIACEEFSHRIICVLTTYFVCFMRDVPFSASVAL
jgi:hypothetical protein